MNLHCVTARGTKQKELMFTTFHFFFLHCLNQLAFIDNLINKFDF